MNDALKKLTITTPEELVRAARRMNNDNWWFRGQGKESWELESTLERSAKDFNVIMAKFQPYKAFGPLDGHWRNVDEIWPRLLRVGYLCGFGIT
jgi:hypothetical protein